MSPPVPEIWWKRLPCGENPLLWSALSRPEIAGRFGAAVYTNLVKNLPFWLARISENRGPRYAMCVPMMAQGEALGILYLDSGQKEQGGRETPSKEVREAQLRLARTLAEHIGLALANLNLREVLRSQSIRDSLTGLFNRRYMEESLERELRRASRKQCSLGVMMIDIDHFKSFNDSFGHDAERCSIEGAGQDLQSSVSRRWTSCVVTAVKSSR